MCSLMILFREECTETSILLNEKFPIIFQKAFLQVTITVFVTVEQDSQRKLMILWILVANSSKGSQRSGRLPVQVFQMGNLHLQRYGCKVVQLSAVRPEADIMAQLHSSWRISAIFGLKIESSFQTQG